MSGALLRGVLLGLAAAVVVGTGVWLTRAGRPYGAALFNVHKLVALGCVIALGVAAYRSAQAAPLGGAGWAIVVSAAALAAASIASGGVLSAMEVPPAWVLWFHRVGTWVTAAVMALGFVRLR